MIPIDALGAPMPFNRVLITVDTLLRFALFTTVDLIVLLFELVAYEALVSKTNTLEIAMISEIARPTGLIAGEVEMLTMASATQVKWVIPAVKLRAT